MRTKWKRHSVAPYHVVMPSHRFPVAPGGRKAPAAQDDGRSAKFDRRERENEGFCGLDEPFVCAISLLHRSPSVLTFWCSCMIWAR